MKTFTNKEWGTLLVSCYHVSSSFKVRVSILEKWQFNSQQPVIMEIAFSGGHRRFNPLVQSTSYSDVTLRGRTTLGPFDVLLRPGVRRT